MTGRDGKWLALAMALVACGEGTVDGDASREDAGTALDDGGSSTAGDATTSSDDAASDDAASDDDAGSTIDDAGGDVDAGSTVGDAGSATDGGPVSGEASYVEVADFGSNPGNARMFLYSPATPATSPALVIAIHGCTQTAAQYRGAGWEDLADELGFYVIYPEQKPDNQTLRCWNWWDATDIGRTGGEVESIAQMIEHVASTRGVDRTRIYVTGLSAGGGMSVVVAAMYPEVIRGAGIMAGMPFDCVASSLESYACSISSRDRQPSDWAARVQAAHAYTGTYPRVSVWVGSADAIVVPGNSREVVEQFTALHGIDATADATETTGTVTRLSYQNAGGDTLVELRTISGMQHGTAIDADQSCGHAAPYVLDVGVCSTRETAAFWGLTAR